MSSSSISLTPITTILSEVRESNCLTTVNRYSLIAAMFDQTLPVEERQVITDIILNVIQGQIKVVKAEQA